MFAKLTGVIDFIEGASLILDVQGVGYLVSASGRTLGRIGGRGDAVSLLIETSVREDAIQLYGFCDRLEQGWFRLLTKVQGVGAKAALAILSACPPESLPNVIAAQDKAALTQADGVGPKLATRILTELKDKAGDLNFSGDAPMASAAANKSPSDMAGGEEGRAMDDALSALVNLGYGRADAFAALSKVKQSNPDVAQDVSALIREGLKAISA